VEFWVISYTLCLQLLYVKGVPHRGRLMKDNTKYLYVCHDHLAFCCWNWDDMINNQVHSEGWTLSLDVVPLWAVYSLPPFQNCSQLWQGDSVTAKGLTPPGIGPIIRTSSVIATGPGVQVDCFMFLVCVCVCVCVCGDRAWCWCGPSLCYWRCECHGR
jgi:hypothetical protein